MGAIDHVLHIGSLTREYVVRQRLTSSRYMAASSVHAVSKRPLCTQPRNVRIACLPASRQRIPERFSRSVTSVLYAASTTPLPIG